MASRRRTSANFVKLQMNYQNDPAVLAVVDEVGIQGETVFVRSLCEAKKADRDGELKWSQCAELKRGVRGWDRVRAALLRHNLWVELPDASGFCIRSWLSHHESRAEREEANAQAAARQQRSRDVRREPSDVDVSHVTGSAKRRGEERRVGPDRTPPGPVRSGPARTAPRDAEGAAPPAPGADVVASTEDPDEPPQQLPGESAAEMARRIAAEGQRKSRVSTGQNVQLSRWNQKQNAPYRDSKSGLDKALADSGIEYVPPWGMPDE